MITTGIRELKNNLSRYIRRVEAGERIAVTDHGRTVAELVPPAAMGGQDRYRFRVDELIARGILRPVLEAGDPLADWPMIQLSPGTARQLIDADRGE